MSGRNLGAARRLKLELFAAVQDKRIAGHELRQLFWECTLRCNASCLHCGSDCKVSSAIKDMPVSDFLRVIDSITPHVDTHRTFIILTGGEPLMRRDLEKVGLELYKREYPWGIVTNGILLDRRRFDSLLSSGIHTATVSLDGFQEEHTWMRGHPKAFENASNAIRMMAQEPGFIFDVVTCVNQRNLPRLKEFKEYLISLGAPAWRIFTIFPVGRAKAYPELQLSNEQFTDLMDFIVETRKEGRIKLSFACEGFLGAYEGEVRDTFYHCDAGVSIASVLADGSISACPSIRSKFYQGNIYKDDFWDVWEHRFIMYRDRGWARQGICADCKMFRYCRGNGMHLHDEEGKLLVCHYNRLTR